MATINLTRDLPNGFGASIKWASMANGDVGNAWDTQDFQDMSVQVHGTFGAGGTLTWQGSNDVSPSNWYTLTDPQGNALTVTSAKIEQVQELTRWMRPNVTAGDGTTALTVTVWAGRRR